MTNVNANDPKIASVLAELGDSGNGTIVCLTVQKKGVVRGKNGNRKVYDDDTVHVLIWTGFNYQALVERSHKKLQEMWGKSDHFIQDLAEKVRAAGFDDVTIRDAAEAVQEVNDSFEAIIQGAPRCFDEDAPVPVNDSVWEPLKVNGLMVKGAKVYRGQGDPDDSRAPIPGGIYIDGVKLGEKVAIEADHWTPERRKPKAVAKEILRSELPVGLYVRYCLTDEKEIKVGAAASTKAKELHIEVDPDSIRSLFKIAP